MRTTTRSRAASRARSKAGTGTCRPPTAATPTISRPSTRPTPSCSRSCRPPRRPRSSRSATSTTASTPTTEWTTNLDFDRRVRRRHGLAAERRVRRRVRGRKLHASARASHRPTIRAGAQSFPAIGPTDAGNHTRTDDACYVDLAGDPFANLHLDLAGRYESLQRLRRHHRRQAHGALRLQPDVRHPRHHQRLASARRRWPRSSTPPPTSRRRSRCQLPPNSPAALVAGFEPLKPEKSTNFSVGFVAHPIDRLQITADAYEIEITDRIVGTGILLGRAGRRRQRDRLAGGAERHHRPRQHVRPGSQLRRHPASSPTAANTRTDGAEITADYASDFGDMGHVDWSVGFNYNETAVTRIRPALPDRRRNPAFGQTSAPEPSEASRRSPPHDAEGEGDLGAFWTLNKLEREPARDGLRPRSRSGSASTGPASAPAVASNIDRPDHRDHRPRHRLSR